ncbi:MAG: hypothetical protein RI907_3943 [Pseudomonadota bacterium]|jgi:PAS domain S-box-containing protein
MRWVTLLVLLTGLLLSGLAAWRVQELNSQKAEDDFEFRSQAIVDQVRQRITLYEYGLRGARGAILATGLEGLSAKVFHIYAQSRDLDAEFPGAHGFGFIRRVSEADLPAFLARARAEVPGFQLHALAPMPPSEHYVIQYIEPLQHNQAARGLDIASEAFRREAARRAMHVGKATLTGPIQLVQGNGLQHKALLFLLPIYRSGLPLTTEAQREAACFGWSYAPLALEEVTRDFDVSAAGLQLSLIDVTHAASPLPLFTGPTLTGEAVLSKQVPIDLYGRTWAVEIRASSDFMVQHQGIAPVSVALTGALLACLVAALHAVWASARLRQRQGVEQNARLAAIVTHSTDAIICESMSGTVLHWNHAAVQLFGWTEAEVLGQPLAQCFLPPDRIAEDHQLLTRIQAGEQIAPFDTTRQSASGDLIDVSVTACAIRAADGKQIGVAKLIRDIRDRKQAERQLQQFNATLERQVQDRTTELEAARKDLQTVLDAVPSMIGYWDRHLLNRFANKAYLNWFGKSPEAIKGRHIQELLGDKIYQANLPYLQGALAGEPQHFERTIPAPDGGRARSSLAHYLPDWQNGEVQGIYVIVHDVSDLVEGRRALDREQARLRNILEGTLTGTWEWNIQANALQVNERWAAIKGRDTRDTVAQSAQEWFASIHPEDRPEFDRKLAAHLQGSTELFECESRQKHAYGHWVWVRDCGRVMVRNEEGRPLHLFGTTQDINVARLAQLQAERLADLLGNVLNSATEQSIIATDASGVITVFNPGAERMLGYRAEEMVGRCTPERIHDEEEVGLRAAELSQRHGQPIQGFRAFVHQAEIDGQESREWTYIRKDGSRLRVSLSVTPLRGADHHAHGYLGIGVDITQRMAQEEALRQAKVSAEEANRAKSMFLANMSHEIRTPLNAVLGAAYLLNQPKLDPQQRHLLNQIQTAGKSLLGIVNDVLDLAKIEAKEMEIEACEFAPAELLQTLRHLYTQQASDKGLSLRIEASQPLPDPIVGDPMRLQQVLSNLLSNAIKFTAAGEVKLTVSVPPTSQPDHSELLFEVSDTGPGIDPTLHERLFQPFTQADSSNTRRYGGTGLGLSIVRELTEAMGGHVGLRSQPGKGSTFWVTLPLPAPRVQASSPLLHVALLEARPEQSQALTAHCQGLGWRAMTCPSGTDLVAHCANLLTQGAPLPDAVLIGAAVSPSELQQTLEALSSGAPASPRPTTLLLDDPASASWNPAKLPLVDAVLVPPWSPPRLLDSVNAAMAQRNGKSHAEPQPAANPAATGPWLQGLRILLVDDSAINLDVGTRLLMQEGAQVTTATQGEEALAALRAPGARFDAVLMDIQMPVMDGLEATRQLRRDIDLAWLPVLALTASALPEERLRALSAGMNDFLTKPLDPERMVHTIRRHVSAARGVPLPQVVAPGAASNLGAHTG